MGFDAACFKAYDIRGVVPTALDEAFAHALGRAFASLAIAQGVDEVAVGRDGRISGPMLSNALMQGLTAGGVNVVDVGMVTTPMLYFAAHTVTNSGIQVTGSHNPKNYNGFKMVLAGRAIFGAEIQRLRELMDQGAPSSPRLGQVRQQDVYPQYLRRILGDVRLSRPIKLIVDTGNGVAGASAPDILRGLGADLEVLFGEVDGEFPNHHPDPSKPENLRDLQAALAAGDAELGLAFDGDGDRLGVITRSGEVIYPDRQMILFAQDVLSRVPGAPILFDVKCSQRLAPAIEAAGGQAQMYKTGHSLIKARMREVDSPLGGEMSGHIFFKERWFGFDDGTYAAARLLEILTRYPDASAVLEALPNSVSTPELNVPCEEGEPHRLVAQLVASAQFDAPAVVNTIDGLRVDWPDGFGLIRASNTTPVLVLRFEGHDEAALARIQATMLALLQAVKPGASLTTSAH